MNAEAFQEHRPRLFGLAYRMLGSASEADDVLQEAWIRWAQAEAVAQPSAWLGRVVTRLCLDALGSARARREQYVGPWLPEPILGVDELGLGGAATLRLAFLRLAEELGPQERAAYLLREVFDRDFEEIAEWIDTSPANARQLVSRARAHLAAGLPRYDADEAEVSALLFRFSQACLTGDPRAIVGMLAPDAVAVSDGGGVTRAALRPILGGERVARFLAGLNRKYPAAVRLEPALINGQPGVLGFLGDWLWGTLLCDVAGGKVVAVWSVVNPQKLGRLRP